MVIQEISFMHRPGQIRSAALHLVGRRIGEPKGVLFLVLLLILLIVGLAELNTWLIALPIAAFVAVLLHIIHYVVTSPRNFCGVEVQLAVREDEVYFSGSNRSGTVGWAGFREVYVFKKMWALFVKNSDAVTFIPTEELRQEALDFMFSKFRSNGVIVHGKSAKLVQSSL